VMGIHSSILRYEHVFTTGEAASRA
jgi:hypothetical protein